MWKDEATYKDVDFIRLQCLIGLTEIICYVSNELMGLVLCAKNALKEIANYFCCWWFFPPLQVLSVEVVEAYNILPNLVSISFWIASLAYI